MASAATSGRAWISNAKRRANIRATTALIADAPSKMPPFSSTLRTAGNGLGRR